MKYTYTENKEANIVIRTDENGEVTFIPMVAGNSDYEAYLNPDKVEHLTEIIPADEA